jgi:hypothetical protein
MDALEDAIRAYHREWDDPCVDRAIFGTTDPAVIAAELRAFTTRALGASIRGVLLYASSVGTAAGVELSDGRRVVIKAHRAGLTRIELDALARFRRAARDAGVPAPELIAVEHLLRGNASVEAYADAPPAANGFDEEVRRMLAQGLWALAEVGLAYGDLGGLRHAKATPAGRIWRTPHSELFDLAKNADGAAWIDAVGERALRGLEQRSCDVFPAHMDWRVEHVRVKGDRIVAVFDWDSVALADEAQMVGTSAAHYASNWQSGFEGRRFPTPDESDAYVADYERARRRPFTREELARIGAVRTYELAYVARLGHIPGAVPMRGGAAEMLLQHGDAYLTVRGG